LLLYLVIILNLYRIIFCMCSLRIIITFYMLRIYAHYYMYYYICTFTICYIIHCVHLIIGDPESILIQNFMINLRFPIFYSLIIKSRGTSLELYLSYIIYYYSTSSLPDTRLTALRTCVPRFGWSSYIIIKLRVWICSISIDSWSIIDCWLLS
jgi:hypothetical protein